jgi:hypothetical protein
VTVAHLPVQEFAIVATHVVSSRPLVIGNDWISLSHLREWDREKLHHGLTTLEVAARGFCDAPSRARTRLASSERRNPGNLDLAAQWRDLARQDEVLSTGPSKDSKDYDLTFRWPEITLESRAMTRILISRCIQDTASSRIFRVGNFTRLTRVDLA